jgi:membrane protease YdiL (CAAX protease family)
MNFVLKYVIPTAAGLAFVYTPFLWCRYRRESPESYGLSWKLDKRSFLECLAVTAAVLAPLTVISLNWPAENLPRYSAAMRTLDLAASGLAAAVIEEIFFRGWVQPLFRKRLSVFFSVVFTSAIFASAHIFVAQTPFLFAVFFPGCIMGFLRERHGNIATPTIFHGMGNLWAIWFAPLYWPTMEWVVQKLALFR